MKSNKRIVSKEQTREWIIKSTSQLVKMKGLMNLSTAEIASHSGISHGNLFKQFSSRENLINVVLQEEIKRIGMEIKQSCGGRLEPKELFNKYLLIASEEEEFLGMLYRDLPFQSLEVIDNVVAMESIIRNYFYMSLMEYGGDSKKKEITVGLDVFFAYIIRLLTMRSIYMGNSSNIAEKKMKKTSENAKEDTKSLRQERRFTSKVSWATIGGEESNYEFWEHMNNEMSVNEESQDQRYELRESVIIQRKKDLEYLFDKLLL